MDEQQAETNTTPTTAAPPDVVAVDTAPIAPPETLPPDPVVVTTDAVTPVVTEEIAPAEPEAVPTASDVVLEPIVTPPAPVPAPATIAPAPELPIIQVDTASLSTDYSPIRANRRENPDTLSVVNGEIVEAPSVPQSPPEHVAPEVQIVERVVEKVVERVVEKEVVKEVPVEKIVEKVVYRDPEPMVCPPPTQEEREAIKRDFLIELSHEGTARKHALVAEKLEKILSLFETRERIMHKDVMDALDCSSTTATRLLTELRHEGKLLLHGQGGNSATYTRVP